MFVFQLGHVFCLAIWEHVSDSNEKDGLEAPCRRLTVVTIECSEDCLLCSAMKDRF